MKNAIKDAIRSAQQTPCRTIPIFRDEVTPYGLNNWLCFIKPEITRPSETINLDAILTLILDRIAAFGFTIHSATLLSADYLRDHRLIKQHYGVLDDVATKGKAALSEAAAERLEALYGQPLAHLKVMGGFELLEAYPFFNAHSLDCLWQNQENVKLTGGTYVEKVRVDLETIYLLNGFHPKQLEHFTVSGRSIVLLDLSGDLSWAESRRHFIGATNPLKAEEGSLRRLLLEQKAALGLPEVSQSFNGVHLSAGPVEALVERLRFESDYDSGCMIEPGSLPFGQQLVKALGHVPDALLSNEIVTWEGHHTSIFDLTEEMDSTKAIEVLSTLRL
jgi:nucleoside diphosphate kinase